MPGHKRTTVGPVNRRRRATWGRIGGLTTRARYSGNEMTRAARAGFQAMFEQEVDPGGRLRAADRTLRARSAMRAHMLQLAERSAAARARRREEQG